jgi:hypothetical protein
MNDTTPGHDDYRLGVENNLFVLSIDTDDDNERDDDDHLSDNNSAFVMDSEGDVGLGTQTIPVGGLGQASLAIHGERNNTNGPHVQMTTDEDDYPVFTMYPFEHDLISLSFDCYWNGTNNMSSFSGSNARLVKYADEVAIRYSSGVGQGNTITMPHAMIIGLTDGSIKLPQVYSDQVSGTYLDLAIKDNGQLGYVPSSARYKENIRDVTASDTAWIYQLQPVVFDYEAPLEGKDQIGLIAEEVELIQPALVGYKRELIYPDPVPGSPEQGEPTIVTTNIPETVSYSKLIVPMLAEIQNLRREVDQIRADIEALEQNP